MKVYHGSDSNFKQLRISKSLVKHRSTLENEGLGIYFTLDKETARQYGKYIYTLDLNKKYLKDFRDILVCEQYIRDMSNEVIRMTQVNILNYIPFDVRDSLINSINFGGIAIDSVPNEIYLILENNARWITGVNKQRREIAYKTLRNYNKNHFAAYLFNYNIPNIGIIKIVSDNVVKIVSKEQSY